MVKKYFLNLTFILYMLFLNSYKINLNRFRWGMCCYDLE